MSDPLDIERTGPHPCPPMYQIGEFGVGSWCPTPDGSGKPEAVVFHFEVKLGEGETVQMGLRLKSRRAVDRLIVMLQENRDYTFPT